MNIFKSLYFRIPIWVIILASVFAGHLSGSLIQKANNEIDADRAKGYVCYLTYTDSSGCSGVLSSLNTGVLFSDYNEAVTFGLTAGAQLQKLLKADVGFMHVYYFNPRESLTKHFDLSKDTVKVQLFINPSPKGEAEWDLILEQLGKDGKIL